MRRFSGILAVLFVASGLLSGCASPTRLPAVPDENYTDAMVPGMPEVRYFLDEDPSLFIEHGMESIRREKTRMAAGTKITELPPAVFLAISGGGDKGAFGARLLLGWTATGTRPEFKASTGNLTALFAFLGSAYDDRLCDVYTGCRQKISWWPPQADLCFEYFSNLKTIC